MNNKKGTIMVEEIEKEDKSNVTPILSVVTNPAGDDPNWLKHLPMGVEFLCRPKSNSYQLPFLGEYKIVSSGAFKAVCLLDVTGGNREIWVDSARFSNQHMLYEIISDGQD